LKFLASDKQNGKCTTTTNNTVGDRKKRSATAPSSSKSKTKRATTSSPPQTPTPTTAQINLRGNMSVSSDLIDNFSNHNGDIVICCNYFLLIYYPCNLLLSVNPFEYGPWNVVCQQCHKRRPPAYYSEELPEVCQACVTFDRVQADMALRQGDIEYLRNQLISEQDRRRNIEHELTQIKLRVCNF